MLAYLDHAASGPVHPEAAASMTPWLTERYGNPSGAHQVARVARAAVDEARDALAAFVGVEPGGITFTSGGTESDNLAVAGVAAERAGPIVVSAIEHPAVIEAARASGREVRLAPVDSDGRVDVAGLKRLLDRTVTLVSIQLVNHETGVVQPFVALTPMVRRLAPNAVLHTDAVQAAQWMDIGEAASGADLISVSGHKLGGPQGVGLLAARGRPPMRPIIFGGGQERELRSGTHNVAGIVGLAAAVAVVARARLADCERVADLRDRLTAHLKENVPDCVVSGAAVERSPGHLHMRFAGVESEALLILLDEAGVCASAGAACASGAIEPSPVLTAMGIDKEDALSSLRISLGPGTTEAEVELAASVVPRIVARLRAGPV